MPSTIITTLLPPPTPSLLTPIDITSSGPHSKFWLRCLQRGRHWGNAPPARSGPPYPSPPSPRLLFSLRVLVFHYLLFSLFLLILHKAHRRHPIPILLHSLQLFTSFVSILTVPTRASARISSVLHSSKNSFLEAWRWPRRRHVARRLAVLARAVGGGARCLRRLLIRACAPAALVSDVIFWSHKPQSPGLDELLLYTCNLLPIAFEAVTGVWGGVLDEKEGMTVIGGVFMILSLTFGRLRTPRGLVWFAVVYLGICVTLLAIRRTYRWWTHRAEA